MSENIARKRTGQNKRAIAEIREPIDFPVITNELPRQRPFLWYPSGHIASNPVRALRLIQQVEQESEKN